MHPCTLSTAGVLFIAVALSACDKREMPQQPKVDAGEQSAEVRAQRKIDELQAAARREWNEAKGKADEAGQELRAGSAEVSADARRAGEKLERRASDAFITTAVHAELARDGGLGASKIDVDTSQGRVALRGEAPSAAARDRAAQLAAAVKGVRDVDNQLLVPAAAI